MSRIVALFGKQKEADKAVAALADSGLDEPRIHLIEDWQESGAKMRPLPTQVPTSGLAGVSVVDTEPASLSGFDDEELFLKRSVQRGGVVLVVDLSSDSDVPPVTDLLEELGGRLVNRSQQ